LAVRCEGIEIDVTDEGLRLARRLDHLLDQK
jgi:hypothetical protein